MSEPMTIWLEVYPFVADDDVIGLVSGPDAWRTTLPVAADQDIHAEVELLLARHGALDDVLLLHSTSWHPDGPTLVITYVAVLACTGPVRKRWPLTVPVDPNALTDAVGRPPAHGAAEVPLPRMVDVVLHGLGHLAYLRDRNANVRAVLSPAWQRHLAAFEPTLAGMYEVEHRAA